MNTLGKWRDLNSSTPLQPWVKAFNDKIRIEALPHLGGREIIIATDSSGLHQENPFETLGLLILDFDFALKWEVLRQAIRRDILKDSRRMSFKQLNEPVRRRALIPFLCAADTINGLCLTIAVNKQIDFLCGGRWMYEQLIASRTLKALWTFESFDRMIRTTHFISLVMAGLCSEGQNVFWISDQDEMFESSQKSEDTLRVLSACYKTFINWPMGTISAGTTEMDKGDRFEEDFAAIPDLAAGALAEIVMRMKNLSGANVSEIPAAGLITDVSPKSDILLSWLADNTQMLKRISLFFDQREDGKFCVSKIWSEKEFVK